jgi:zinc-binding alcohol dehydrogenase family protein
MNSDGKPGAHEVIINDLQVFLNLAWLQVLRQGGVFVTIAARLADDAGVKHGVRIMGSGRASADKLQVISELLESKEIKPIVGAVFPLADAQKVQELSQIGHGRGRIILHIADEQNLDDWHKLGRASGIKSDWSRFRAGRRTCIKFFELLIDRRI